MNEFYPVDTEASTFNIPFHFFMKHSDTTHLPATVSGVNLKHTGLGVATRAQCNIVLNCTIEILLLN